jgi:acyl-CoA thioesterase-1
VTPTIAGATKIGVIVALACGATYLTAAGREALTDRTEAARTANATGTVTPGERGAAPTRPPSALFIGDGWTAGTGEVDRERSFACLTATSLGWICNNAGEAGTGYLADGDSGRPYLQRIAAYQRLYAADYVVVSGGSADDGAPLALRVAAAGRTLDAVHAAFPRARVVVVGPFAIGDNAGRDLRRFDTALRDDARRRGWLYVETLDPPWIPARLAPGLMSEDGDTPTAAGHGHLAGMLSAALKSAGIRPGEPPARAPTAPTGT